MASLNVPYIDKKTGIVQVVNKPISEGGETKFYKIPVSTLATPNEYTPFNSQAVDMIPDANYRGILYFEDKGIGLGAKRSGTQQYRSSMRLVCWLNTEKLNGGVADMMLVTKIMNDIIQQLTVRINNSSPFINLSVAISNIPEATSSIFGQYDYDEKRTQYLFSPYDFFALDLSITFDLAKGCIPDLGFANPVSNC